MNTHSFSTELAKEYGINEALLLQHFYFWHQRNKSNNHHFYDNHYWTYNSVKAFNELFDYLTPKQISYTIEKLKEQNLLITGNYNKNTFDRTLWYALTEKALSYFGKSILQNCQMEKTKLSNGEDKIVKSYIDTNIEPDIKPNTNTKESVCVENFLQMIDNYFLTLPQQTQNILHKDTKAMIIKWLSYLKDKHQYNFDNNKICSMIDSIINDIQELNNIPELQKHGYDIILKCITGAINDNYKKYEYNIATHLNNQKSKIQIKKENISITTKTIDTKKQEIQKIKDNSIFLPETEELKMLSDRIYNRIGCKIQWRLDKDSVSNDIKLIYGFLKSNRVDSEDVESKLKQDLSDFRIDNLDFLKNVNIRIIVENIF